MLGCDLARSGRLNLLPVSPARVVTLIDPLIIGSGPGVWSCEEGFLSA